MQIFTRRRLLTGAIASLVLGGGTYLYARTIEPRWLEVVSHELPLRNLPDAFADFKIAQISDLHFGPWVSPEEMNPVVDQVLSLRPDIVVITGDLVTRVGHGETDMIQQTILRLRAPHGVFAILGNHDHWSNASVVTIALEQAGATVLNNQHHPLRRDGQSLYLVGVDDVYCGKQDFAAALRGIPADADSR